MPSVPVTSALWDRLTILASLLGRTVEDLVDEMLSESVVYMENLDGPF